VRVLATRHRATGLRLVVVPITVRPLGGPVHLWQGELVDEDGSRHWFYLGSKKPMRQDVRTAPQTIEGLVELLEANYGEAFDEHHS